MSALLNQPYRIVAWFRLILFAVVSLSITACSTLTPKSPTPAPMTKAPKIALVLGGGGAKGFAHIGVIKALEKNGITPTLVVGTSVGSLIGSLYASGQTPMQLEQLAMSTPDRALMDVTLSNQGFIEGIKLKNFINTQVGGQSIEAFPIRFAAIAAEKHTLKKTVFTTGDTGLAVQASCSVPNIFIAPRIPERVGKKYIDGGVVSLVPVDSARDLGADIVIAVDVTAATAHDAAPYRPTIHSLGSFWGFLDTHIVSPTMSNRRSSSITHERNRADILIIPNTRHVSSIDTSQRQALITAGMQATELQISAIKQLIQEKSTSQ